jgi:uncharacterized protein (TIGR02246 family)
VNGLKMYYEIHGVADGKNPPLVLLHGGGSTIDTTFGKILPSLPKTRQVVAFEQQGHGHTADIADAQLAVFPGGHGAYIGEITAARLADSKVRFGVASSSSKEESKLPQMVVATIDEFLFAPMPEPKAVKSTMLPHKHEDWPSQFEQNLNAGDLEAVMALYEPDARFVARSGETIVGSDRIRGVLPGIIRSKTKFQSRVIKAITVDDVALLYTDFQGTTVDASGKTIEIRHKAIEVLRRQPDGAWKLIVGDPNGRE